MMPTLQVILRIGSTLVTASNFLAGNKEAELIPPLFLHFTFSIFLLSLLFSFVLLLLLYSSMTLLVAGLGCSSHGIVLRLLPLVCNFVVLL